MFDSADARLVAGLVGALVALFGAVLELWPRQIADWAVFQNPFNVNTRKTALPVWAVRVFGAVAIFYGVLALLVVSVWGYLLN